MTRVRLETPVAARTPAMMMTGSLGISGRNESSWDTEIRIGYNQEDDASDSMSPTQSITA
jgi:hypothetical protein